MLYLLPNLLGDIENITDQLPPGVAAAVAQLDGLIAEDPKEGRRFLKRFTLKKPLQEIPVVTMKGQQVIYEDLLLPIKDGQTWGLVSDAGLPCIADPGGAIVARARVMGIPIRAFPGPCSMTLALMLSGLPGQRWAFHGYLDKSEEGLKHELRKLEARAGEDNATQMFMEVPFKNLRMWRLLMESLSPETLLAYARDLTLPSERVETRTVENWMTRPVPDIDRFPVVFLIAKSAQKRYDRDTQDHAPKASGGWHRGSTDRRR